MNIKWLSIASGVILLGFVFILSANKFNVFGEQKNEASLRARYDQLFNLKDYGKAYDEFILGSAKTNLSRDKFITDQTEAKNQRKNEDIVSESYKINKVVISGDIGYIDRTLIYCKDASCKLQEYSRDYKKWVYENNHWYYSTETPACIRDTAYNNPPELARAISLIFQRYTETYGKDKIEDFSKCIYADYSPLSEEAIFVFDSKVSSPDKLVIHVSNSYKSYDDLTIALLLSHEITHAGQFLTYWSDNKSQNCFTDEAKAFLDQFFFTRSLNSEEQKSILLRMGTYRSNQQIEMLSEMTPIGQQAYNQCNNGFSECYVNTFQAKLESWLKTVPYYQKECGN
jgi:hypothetical protein